MRAGQAEYTASRAARGTRSPGTRGHHNLLEQPRLLQQQAKGGQRWSESAGVIQRLQLPARVQLSTGIG